MTEGYKTELASSVGEFDGMSILLSRINDESVAEVFEDDNTGIRTFRAHTCEPVPLEAIELLAERARLRL